LEVTGGRQKYAHLLLCQHSRNISFHAPQANEPWRRPIDQSAQVEKIEEAAEGVQGPVNRRPLETLVRDNSQEIPDIKMCCFRGWHIIQKLAKQPHGSQILALCA